MNDELLRYRLLADRAGETVILTKIDSYDIGAVIDEAHRLASEQGEPVMIEFHTYSGWKSISDLGCDGSVTGTEAHRPDLKAVA